MSGPERTRVVYVTSDSSLWMAVNVPSGLITPPIVELHRPLVGPVQFYHASAYQLPVPPEAEAEA